MTKSRVEEALLVAGQPAVNLGVREEVKKQLWLAGPMIAGGLLRYVIQMISVMYVGHLGELPLAGASMANSFATVTGFSLMLGMASALDTLCGQAFGARQYRLLGIYKQRAMLLLTLVSIPIAVIWFYTGHILLLCGQDADIAAEAGTYARWMIPALFAYGLLQCHVRFLQTQSIVLPVMVSAGTAAACHLVVCWVLVYKLGMGSKGAALSNAISYWLSVAVLAVYVRVSSDCKETWTGFSMEAFRDAISFFRLAIPSALMVCLEMWSFELIVLLSGLLPNPKLETAVLSISLNTAAFVWMIPFGLSSAIRSKPVPPRLLSRRRPSPSPVATAARGPRAHAAAACRPHAHAAPPPSSRAAPSSPRPTPVPAPVGRPRAGAPRPRAARRPRAGAAPRPLAAAAAARRPRAPLIW